MAPKEHKSETAETLYYHRFHMYYPDEQRSEYEISYFTSGFHSRHKIVKAGGGVKIKKPTPLNMTEVILCYGFIFHKYVAKTL